MLVPLAGFLAGMHHVVTGPDHLAAVAPLAVTDRQAAWRGGLSWAAGHAGGVGIIALVALAIREAIPFDAHWLSGWSERLVGAVLVGIGLWGLRKALGRHLHTHVHDHQGHRHVHVHLHSVAEAHDAREEGAHDHHAHEHEHAHGGGHGHSHSHGHAAFAVGTLHGLAGGSHFLGVLPALALRIPDAVMYLGAYALGTVAAMVAFATAVGWLAARATSTGTHWARGLMLASSAAAIAVGIFWLVSGLGRVA